MATCAACGGSSEEHGPGLTQHAFTEKAGELITHDQLAKRNQAPSAPMVVKMGQAANSSPVASGRLTEVLLDLGLIGVEHALYIAGMGPKPEKPSGYADPMARQH